MYKLLSCPFCGKNDIHILETNKDIPAWHVMCINIACPVTVVSTSEVSWDEAISAWNLRTSGWRSMDSAPKDGTVILAWHSEAREVLPVRWRKGAWHRYKHEPSLSEPCLTSWQPLPAGPNE